MFTWYLRYDEIKDYNWGTRKSNGGVIGHFTQLVWKDVKKVGVGMSRLRGRKGGLFVVARYDMAGNSNKYKGKWVVDQWNRPDKYKVYGLEVKPRKRSECWYLLLNYTDCM